ncbi:FLYWCH zinc finger domain-containing protein [Phthorimaea operculella]|nr:FLYWCH zinc finger domain-containing protein [Phthorimaea operculella]
MFSGNQVAEFMEINGRSCLIVGSNRFMRHYTSRRGRTRWRCCKSFNKCRAIAITADNVMVKLKDVHNHGPGAIGFPPTWIGPDGPEPPEDCVQMPLCEVSVMSPQNNVI